MNLQYELDDKCKRHIHKQAEQHFLKWYNFLKESENFIQKTKENAFVQALSALSILRNFNVNVDEHVRMLKNAFKSVSKPQEASDRSRKFDLNTDGLFKGKKVDELNRKQQIKTEFRTEDLFTLNKWGQTKRKEIPNGILQTAGYSSLNEKDVGLSDSSRDKIKRENSDTSPSKYNKSDILEKHTTKAYSLGQQPRLLTRRRTTKNQIKTEESMQEPKDFKAKSITESTKASFPSLCAESLRSAYHDSERSSGNGDNIMTLEKMYRRKERTFGESEALYLDLEQQKIPRKRANLLGIESHRRRPDYGGFHCYHEALARQRYQDFGLSISKHITWTNLIEEYMDTSIQERSK
ncbi:unnamed protein product [Schistosoma turkestanicum]|nr:unnamed protein product [Schistosoma turkestanicum]